MTEYRGEKSSFLFLSLLSVPVIFLLHNLNFFRQLLFYQAVYWLLTGYFLLPFLFYVFFRWVTNASENVVLLCTWLLSSLFFFFGSLQDFLLAHSLTHFFGKTYVLPVLFLAALVYLLWRKPLLTTGVKAIQVALVFFALSEIVMLLFALPTFSRVPKMKEETVLKNDTRAAGDSLTIYHLIFDGYAASSILDRLFGYHNPIDSFLVENGFYVAQKTKSNYNFTPYSLGATLNLNYLELNQKALQRDFKNYLLGAKVYQQNKVFAFFKSKGYTVSHFSLLDDYDYLDRLGTFVPKTPFYSLRYQTPERIFLNPWLWQKSSATAAGVIPPSVKKSLQAYVQYNEKATVHVLQPPSDQKEYRFTHFLLPHEPYVFSKASVDSLRLDDLMDYAHGYIQQVKYANALLIKLVTQLRKNKHAIIIIQGDHGFRDYDFSKWDKFTQTECLNALYFPDQAYQTLYDSISPVNTYRVLLSQYFGQQLPLLKDQQFVPHE